MISSEVNQTQGDSKGSCEKLNEMNIISEISNASASSSEISDKHTSTDLLDGKLTESSILQAITTLEAFLKVPEEIATSKELKRLQHAARQVVVKDAKSKQAQRKIIQELVKQKDQLIANSKGIRLSRKMKEAKIKQVFQIKDTCHLQDNLPKDNNDTTKAEISPDTNNCSYKQPFECYICKSYYHLSHNFYDQMCVKCGEFNFHKRTQTANLSGKIALVTGGRIKIGYETALILLRAGCHVIVTTRFPVDAALRYSHEYDFEDWKHRLEIYGIDFRFIRLVEAFCIHLNDKYPKLDILIQNAAQTIRRPVQFYQHLLEAERNSEKLALPVQSLLKQFEVPIATKNNLPLYYKGISCTETVSATVTNGRSLLPSSAERTQLIIHPEDMSCTSSNAFPVDKYDEHHQQVDLRQTNSWMLQLDQVETTELVEVHLINSIAPFVILNRLMPLLAKSTSSSSSSSSYGWIIMVSSMEGKFTREKTTFHPHTNCAKASLNMIVRTSAAYYKSAYNLLMNAVDTGWITDEDPLPIRRTHFHPPLDETDGAARILDPIFQTINHGKIIYGCFLKDYHESSW